jgi:hypothetical protein
MADKNKKTSTKDAEQEDKKQSEEKLAQKKQDLQFMFDQTLKIENIKNLRHQSKNDNEVRF